MAKKTARELKNPKRCHPDRTEWIDAEARQRASYHATRAALAPFLVPHRFEGDKVRPEDLRRARYGYGIGLNKAYLAEIIGHVSAAKVSYNWGRLTAGGDEGTTERPADGPAALLWDDATLGGTSWPAFVESVIEWILSSPGGVIVVDSTTEQTATAADERVAGKRPFVKFVPWSAVEDFSRDRFGFRWIKIKEEVDEREPDGETDGHTCRHMLYRRQDDGTTQVERFDEDGKAVGVAVNLGEFTDPTGRPVLPIVEARFGEHPDMPYAGAGLLLGLDDIVIDIFNLTSETREGYRDGIFGIIKHKGPDADKIRRALKEGSRFIALGSEPNADLERLAGDPQEATVGLELIAAAIRNWALAAMRKAIEAQNVATDRSGLSIAADFQVGLAPLLVKVVHALDQIETNVMFVVAQMAGNTPEQAEDLVVERSDEFNLEPEATRISRIVGEFTRSLDIPAEAKVRIIMRWLEATNLFDLSAPVDGEDGKPLREVLEAQAREVLAAEQKAQIRRAEFDVPPTFAT